MTEYRYGLFREVALHGNGLLCWVMLNPSTADDTTGFYFQCRTCGVREWCE